MSEKPNIEKPWLLETAINLYGALGSARVLKEYGDALRISNWIDVKEVMVNHATIELERLRRECGHRLNLYHRHPPAEDEFAQRCIVCGQTASWQDMANIERDRKVEKEQAG